jgi:hypothetical protein
MSEIVVFHDSERNEWRVEDLDADADSAWAFTVLAAGRQNVGRGNMPTGSDHGWYRLVGLQPSLGGSGSRRTGPHSAQPSLRPGVKVLTVKVVTPWLG